MINEKNIFKEVAGVLTSSVTTILIGFITGVLISRVLGPELKGEYTSLLVIPGMLSSFVMLGSRNSIIYHVGKKIFNNQQIISAVTILYFISCLFGLFLFLVFYWIFINKTYSFLIILIVLFYFPLKLALTYLGSIFLANLNFKKANRLKWMTALLTLIFVSVFVIMLNWSILGAFLGLLIATLLVVIYAFIQISKEFEIKIQYDRAVISRLVKLGFINAFALLVIQLNFRIDILIMNVLSTEKEIGFYSVGVSIAEKLWLLPFAVGVVMTSRSASNEHSHEHEKDICQLLRLTFTIILIACMLLFFFAPYLIPLIYGQAFNKSVFIVQNILPGILFFVIVRILSSSLVGLGKTYLILMIFIPALFLNVLLNILWVPKYGGIGAAWATNVSYILGAIALLILYSLQTKISIQKFIMFDKDDFKMFRKINPLRINKWIKSNLNR